jgi:hypothetical protein
METGLSVTPELLKQINEQIAAIDEQLEAAKGEAPGKTKLRNDWMKGETEVDGQKVNATEQFVQNVVNQILSSVEAQSPEFKAGAYFGLVKTLTSKDSTWKEEAEKLLEASVPEKTEGDAQVIDITQLQELRKSRNELVDQFVAIKNILTIMRPDMESVIEGIATPDKIKGALPGTTKGPRKLSQMQFYVDGVALTPDKNSMGGLAELVPVKNEKGETGARPFRQALDSALKALVDSEGNSLKKSAADPGDSFEVVIEGKTVSGQKFASADEPDEEEDEPEVTE